MAKIASKRVRPDAPTRRVVSAGGVIFDDKGRVLLLKRADERIWCFPKGHVEPGESLEQAAAREIREECGLVCEIGGKVAEVRYSYHWPPEDVNYDKRVVYFLARPVGGSLRLEDRFDDSRWMPPDAAMDHLFHANDKIVLRRAVRALPGKT